MATGQRTSNTFVELLRKLLTSLTDLKMADDADLPFIIGLETQILQRLREGADQAMQPSPQTPSGLMGSPSPAPGLGTPSMVPGLQQGPQPPNPDELRRVLTQR